MRKTVCVLIGMQLAFTSIITCAKQRVYSIGVVPQYSVTRIQSIWEPILKKIYQDTGVRLELVASPNIPRFEKQYMKSRFDFAYMNPYHMIRANRANGYVPLLRDRGARLRGIIVVRKDSGITRLQHLDNSMIAFPAPNALGASLIPRALLSRQYQLKVRARYVRSHTSVYLNVLMKQVIAGGGVQKTLDQQPAKVRNRLRVLYRTPPVNPHPLAVHPRVPKSVRDRVVSAFIRLGKSEEGKRLLAKIPIRKIGKARMKDYRDLVKMGLERYWVE